MYDDGHKHCFACNYHINNKQEEVFDLSEFTYEFLPFRDISKDVYKFYDVKTKIDYEGKPVSLGFKYPNAAYKIYKLGVPKKERFTVTGEINDAGLFGRDKFEAGSSRFVTVAEGEIDTLSLYQTLGDYPVVGVQSSSTAARDCTRDRSWLNSFERIYLAFDGDESGRRACAEVARLFDYNKVFVVKYTKRKDANEFLEHGEGDELKRLWWNSKLYMPDDIVSDFNEFETILDNPKKIGIPYPWKIVNDMTYGLRTGETVLITAPEKVGKTEVMHFIEHQLLTETNDNVGAIFLEEPPQRHLQALAGIHLRDAIHLPDKDRPRDEVLAALKEVVKVDGRLHIYSHFGSDDPHAFLDLVRFLATARNCRWVLLDHISMVVSGILGGNGDERKLIDYLSTRLEMLVKQLDIGLVMVSHVNDYGQTRGSRWLTKVCDLQIALTRDMMSSDPTVRNTINVSIPISRYPGITGNCGGLLYDRETYSFKEKADNDNPSPQAGQDQGQDQGAAQLSGRAA